jgi:hypothetical protein
MGRGKGGRRDNIDIVNLKEEKSILLKNNPINQLQEKFHVINEYQKQEGKNEIFLTGFQKGDKNIKLMLFAQWFCTNIARPQTCKHCCKIPPIQKCYQKKRVCKKELETCFINFYKGKKNRYQTSHRFFHKTSCIFCWTWESLPAGTVAADSKTQRLVYRTIAC